ncbi:MAG: A/G-specific adenine glycosylase [Paludibacter sp.]
MITSEIQHYINKVLHNWYNTNKRELPWRNTTDPYRIWISEVILQQTRVNQGLEYYNRFVERFPSVKSLAEAEEDEVLKYWQGLGYYSRARNLHKAAKQVSEKHNNLFPSEYKQVLDLAGIGDYTAAAICSIAYNQPYAVVDGNVYRVLSRLFGISTPIDSVKGKKEFSELAQDLLSKSESALHNQAMMEFGALQCTPVSPDCADCPLQSVCHAFASNSISELPVKQLKTKTSNRYFNYLFINYNGKTFLQKRTGKDVWQNLYEFPLIESDKLLSLSELTENEEFRAIFEGISTVELIKTTNPIKHILSHRIIIAQFITVTTSQLNNKLNNFIITNLSEIDHFAVSRLMEQFLEKLD